MYFKFNNLLRIFSVFFVLLSGTILHATGKTVLLTGGMGFIGSHIAVELLENHYDVIIADNLSNSKIVVLDRIESITGRKPAFYDIDIRDEAKLSGLFRNNDIFAVVHLAAFKSVKESVAKPRDYYDNNLASTLNLLKVMKEFDCRRIVFSSSATVYGSPKYLPLDENHPVNPVSPYGRTKLMNEEILRDEAASSPDLSVISFRYFNPIGAHESGLIGEDPQGVPNNLMPYILQVITGKLPFLTVNGVDYETKDGTGVRDYIHIVDLARAHLAAIRKMEISDLGFKIYNLGTGTGYSVFEILNAVSNASGSVIPHQVGARREGDVAEVFANPSKAETELNWKAEKGLESMAKDAINWIRKNPKGYSASDCHKKDGKTEDGACFDWT
jgi:UDP-glucose 4-epimerase